MNETIEDVIKSLEDMAATLDQCDEFNWLDTPEDIAEIYRSLASRLRAISKRGTLTVEKKDWLELPRNITLKRFVNTKRETHFIGQYRDDKNPGNPNPRRVYTLDVVPIGTADLAAVDLPPVWEVACREDDNLLFKITTRRGRAAAEYLGVKALKAWLNYCGSQRRGKQSLKNHHKRYRANLRARKAAAKAEPLSPEAELAATVKRQKEIL